MQLVPEFHTYKYDNEAALSEITSNPTKFRNSSLAIQLCFDWLRKNPSKISDPLIHDHLMNSDDSRLPDAVVDGLLHCYWPGRCQVVIRRNITFHIDGAHTADSLKLCVDWFNNQTKTSHRKKVLIFNSTGDRDSHEMLKMIFDNVSSFDEAVFSPNIASPANRVQGKTTIILKTGQQVEIFRVIYFLQRIAHIQPINRIIRLKMFSIGHSSRHRIKRKHSLALLMY